jgi:hypothetical protein
VQIHNPETNPRDFMSAKYLFKAASLMLLIFSAACSPSVSPPEAAQEQTAADRPQTAEAVAPERSTYPAVEPGRFDNGKMWTFEHPPADYFLEEYNLELTAEWLSKARMGVVRLPNCTGSFISPKGLIITNHHCTRDAVLAVSGNGENLVDEGFLAFDTGDERRIPDYYVDQLIAIEDVTEAIYAALGENGDVR